MQRKKTFAKLLSMSGKTAIITGGAKGIGYGIAQRFSEAGARVVIADVDDATGSKKAKTLGSRTIYAHCDVSKAVDVQKLVETAVLKYGGVDVMVNNAGIFPSKPVMEMDENLWDTIQAVNLKSTFLCCKEAAKAMTARGGGAIVNIASIDAIHPSQIGLAAYDASKHGVWGFTKNFALEVAPMNIRVNAIAPGGISTEGVEEMTKGAIKAGTSMDDTIKSFTARIPLKRFGVPDDIATVALFLASDAAAYMTGSIVVVDGGYLLS